jgi:iron(III) transport system ATP-binding protein
MTAITLSGVTKRFGATTAVDQIDLSVRAGELFFLLGPSGCGKTTLLRLIAGFLEPTSGTIHFGDRDVTSTPPNRRNTGMVFQSYALWPHMTVFDNVAYGLNVRDVRAAERRRRVTEALRTVHMEHLAKRRPNELSGGQQQRVALARALVIAPTVLLLDEPLSNLDAKLRLEMRLEIKRICEQTRITTVYVTHDQKEALSMADTVAVLHDGRLMQVGPPRALYDRPASRFVADFLGETNFVPATVVASDATTVTLETPVGRLSSALLGVDRARSLDDGAAPAPGDTVTCSIRPEALRLVEHALGANTLVGRRLQTIYLGEMAQHVVELPAATVVKVLELNPRPDSASAEWVNLAIDPAQVVVLRH